MDKSQINCFFKLMQKHVVFYAELRDFEYIKMNDIYANRFDKLDDHVKKEEAFVLRARGLEAEREKLFEQIGFADMKMRQIIASLPDEYSEQGKELFSSLSGLTEEIKSINTKCMSMSELRVHRLRQMIERFENKGELTASSPAKTTLSAKI